LRKIWQNLAFPAFLRGDIQETFMESLALYQQAAEIYTDLSGAGLIYDRGEYTGEETSAIR